MGGAVLGTYSVFVAVLIWSKTITGSGLHEAVKKRISETGGSTRDLSAGLVLQAVGFLIVAIIAVMFSDSLNSYLGFRGTLPLVGTLSVVLAFAFVRAALEGQRKVHISSLLWPLDRVVRSGLQLGVVFLGLLGGGLVGLVWGYAAGAVTATVVGLLALDVRLQIPRREDFEYVLGFVRYSWLSGIEERTFSSMDTVVLALFVAPNLIGYYEVAWNLASILAVFGTSISDSLFPSISKLESQNEHEAISGLVSDAITYTGLFIVPGLVGAAIVGSRILGIYGTEFQEAETVLIILVLARLIYAYEAQFISTLNAINRPEVAFRVNAIFVAATLGLNILLISQFGWVGAAIATTIAASIGLVLAYRALAQLLNFEIPVRELANQGIAAAVMGVVVYVAELSLEPTNIPGIYVTLFLVGVGAVIYFGALGGISQQFRTTFRDNIPL